MPVDHGLLVYEALRGLAPWIAEEELLAIHPVQGADMGDGRLMLNRRAKLVMRVPRARVDEALKLSGQSFELAGAPFALGQAKLRPLTYHTPLYAHLVTTGSADEKAFAADIIRLLDELDIDSRFICGKRQALTTERGTEYGYSLMLHGLPIEHAILIQQQGLGTNRKLGCGVFIPHKSITPVA